MKILLKQEYTGKVRLNMTSAASFIKGMATGVVIGAGMSMMVSPIDKKDIRRLEKKTDRLFSSMGMAIDNMLDSMRCR